MLCEVRADALADEARPLLRRHRAADELALLPALFQLWAVCVGEEEAKEARWVSLRSKPHWFQGEV